MYNFTFHCFHFQLNDFLSRRYFHNTGLNTAGIYSISLVGQLIYVIYEERQLL